MWRWQIAQFLGLQSGRSQRFRTFLAGGLPVLSIGMRPAVAAVIGEFLYRTRGSWGGITGADANGTTFFGILPITGFGYQTTHNFISTGIHEFMKADISAARDRGEPVQNGDPCLIAAHRHLIA